MDIGTIHQTHLDFIRFTYTHLRLCVCVCGSAQPYHVYVHVSTTTVKKLNSSITKTFPLVAFLLAYSSPSNHSSPCLISGNH